MSATLPSDSHVVTDTGHTLAHNNLVDCLSTITGASPGGSVSVLQTIETLLPLTALGDTLYMNALLAPQRLPGNLTSTKKFLTQTGTGTISQPPAWNTIVGSDLFEVQNYGGIFGDGSDGAVTFDGSTTVLGLVPSGSAYTMTRDIYCTSITINAAVTLKPHGFRIFCQGTFTNNGIISSVGNNASGTNNGTGGSATGSGTIGGGRAGASGATGAGSTPGSVGSTIGTSGAGGNGGTAGGTAGGAAPTTAASIATAMGFARQPYAALAGLFPMFFTSVLWAVAGGSSGAGDGTNVGGGGGSGGGVVMIFAWSFVNNGTVTVIGGNGGTPTTAAANVGVGGGGGGSGGLVLAYTLVAWTAGTMTVTGGTAGNGLNGSGGSGATNGTNGSNGGAFNFLVT